MKHRRVVNWALVLSVTIAVHVASAPKASSIAGHAVDGAGYPVPGVSITAMPEAGGTLRHATTGVDGAYQLADLPEGTYRVDFDIRGFDLSRRNHVRVRQDATAAADATLLVSAICDCVQVIDSPDLRERAGQVLDRSGGRLAHARLEIATPLHHEVAYADGEGRFRIRVPVKESWPLKASDSGFGAVTLQVSWKPNSSIVFRLPRVGAEGLPDTERLRRPCCPGDVFTLDRP